MKIIHTSDVHLNSPMTTRLSPAPLATRKRELTESFRRVIDYAKREYAEAVIISGDLFDSARINTKALDSLLGVIEKCEGLEFFYLPGNHEGDVLVNSGLRIPENLKIFGEEWTSYKIENVVISGRSSTSPDMFAKLALDPDCVNIVALHGEIADRSGYDEKIGLKDIADMPIDYLALGHYHTYSVTEAARGVAVYSGTPEGRGFDETGEKGFVEITTLGRTVSHRFIPSSIRQLRIVEVDISDAKREIEIENRISFALSGIPGGDLVRVILTGKHEPGIRRECDALTERFKSGFFFLEIRDSSKLRISMEDYKHDISLKGEFIRTVLASEETTEEEKEAIIELGLRALAGETL